MTRILCYHSVDPDWPSALSIPTETFEQQASWIARNLEVLDLSRAVAALDRSGALPPKRTAITFDDGYLGVHRHAFPVLSKLGLRATLFLVSGALDGSGRADWVDDRDRAGTEVAVMGTEQVGELAEAGWSFGSHSHTHRDLTALSEEECERDLRQSREVLGDVLGTPVDWLAYPRGRHAAHVRRAARAAGFTHGFTLPDERERVEALALPRVGIYRGDGVLALRAKLARWYLPVRTGPGYPALRRVVRAARRATGRAG